MKYSKKVREEAALICAIAASGGVYVDMFQSRTRVYANIAEELDASRNARDLALLAYVNARTASWTPELDADWTPELDAEIEASLRTGWSP